jgi:hypothetical protein
MSYLAIQQISIRYTDDQRGRVHAEQRERIRALPLAPIAGDGVLHECRVDAWAGFEPRTSVSGVPLRDGAVHLDELVLRIEGSTLVFARDPAAETWASKTILTVDEGQWARVISNAKRVTHDAKWLVEIVVNAGLFAIPPAADVFLGTPAAERDVRRDFLRNAYR